MYYSYYMLPDGTYCLAPPPPGIDVTTYYSTLPAGVTVSNSPGVTTTVPPPPGTTPPPPPTTAETSSGVTSTTTTTRYLCHLPGVVTAAAHQFSCSGLHTCVYRISVVTHILVPYTWTHSFWKAEVEGPKVHSYGQAKSGGL